jgi:Zn-dependent metalloprotease
MSPHGTLRGVWGPDLDNGAPTPGQSAEARAEAFLARWFDLFGLPRFIPSQFRHATTHTWSDLGTVVRFRQHLPDGIRILDHDLRVWLDTDGRVRGAWGAVLPYPTVPPGLIAAEEAEDRVRALHGHLDTHVDPKPAVFDPVLVGASAKPPERVWLVDTTDPVTQLPAASRFYVSQATGEILHRIDLTHHGDSMRIIWHPEDATWPELVFVRDEPEPDELHLNWPSTTHNVFLALDRTHTYLTDEHGRDGWNDNHDSSWHRSLAIVNDNAAAGAVWVQSGFFYPPSHSIVLAPSFTCTDIIAHELIGHGVAQAEGVFNLYEGRVIQEAYGDIFAQLVARFDSGSTDWLLGTGEACTSALLPTRDLTDPETPTACPSCVVGAANYSNFLRWKDSAGEPSVHNDAGIINTLGWLIGRDPDEGPTSHGGQTVTGIGHIETGALLYDVLTGFATATTDLNEFGNLLLEVAQERLVDPNDFHQVAAAVSAVGLWGNDELFGDGALRSVHRPAFHTFEVQGQTRTYYFFTQEIDGITWLRAQWKPCALEEACNFAEPEDVLSHVGTGPAVVDTPGKLHVLAHSSLGGGGVLQHVYMDENGTWSSFNLYKATYSETEPAAVAFPFFSSWLIMVCYKGTGSGRQPIHCLQLGDNGEQLGEPEDVGYFAEGALAAARVEGTPILAYIDGGMLYYLPISESEPLLADLQEDVLLTGSVAASSAHGRLHIAALTLDGLPAYKSYCPEQSTCTYRPGEWTNTVALPHLGVSQGVGPPPEPWPAYVGIYGDPGYNSTTLFYAFESQVSPSLMRRTKHGE